jgi:transcriptional regulator with XRE-family HTH domain
MNETKFQTFGQAIKHIRKSKNLTQKQVGAILGFSNRAVSQYENDQIDPTITMIRKFENAYNVAFLIMPDFIQFLDLSNRKS